jgi:hypothetical protein
MREFTRKKERSQSTDILWGAALAIMLPLVTAVACGVYGRPGDSLEEVARARASVPEEKGPRSAPLSPELAEDIVKEIQRIYEQNVRDLFFARLGGQSLDSRERLREFNAAGKALKECGTLLVQLKADLADPRCEIRNYEPIISRWEQQLAFGGSELERLSPFPKGIRSPAAGGRADE